MVQQKISFFPHTVISLCKYEAEAICALFQTSIKMTSSLHGGHKNVETLVKISLTSACGQDS
jgi:hypothetical protein